MFLYSLIYLVFTYVCFVNGSYMFAMVEVDVSPTPEMIENRDVWMGLKFN